MESYDSAEEAASDWAIGGDWGQDEGTVWVDVWVTDVDEVERLRAMGVDEEEAEDDATEMVTVAIDPDEPDCCEDDHNWCQPDWLGGCSENPGVWSSGAAAKGTDVCSHCGIYRKWDSWATRLDTGQQGLDSVSYEPADEQSEEWISKR
jgi:hypothetical protein